MGGHVGVSAVTIGRSFIKVRVFSNGDGTCARSIPVMRLTQLSFPLHSWEDVAEGASSIPQSRSAPGGERDTMVLPQTCRPVFPKTEAPFYLLCCYFSFP